MLHENIITEYFKEVFRAVLKEELPKLQQREKNVEKTDELLSISEVADYLKISKATIYTKTSRNEIPFTKVGKKVYFRKSEIDKWLQDGRVLTNSELEAVAERLQTNKRSGHEK